MANYEIGYGKPPASGRFRAGVSGNPKGRPKRKPSPLAERIKTVAQRSDRVSGAGKNQGRDLSRTEPQDARRQAPSAAISTPPSWLSRSWLAPSATAIQASTRFWSRTGSPTIPVRPPIRKPPTSRPGATPRLPNGGGRPRIDREGQFTMFVPSTARGRSHLARTAAFRAVKGLLGLAASSLQGASLRKAVRQDGVRQDLDCAGARARGGMRLVCSPAYDLVRGLFGFDANAPADRGRKLQDASRDPSLERRPHRLLVVGKSDRRPRSAISAHCDRRGCVHQGRGQPVRRFDDGALGEGDQADLIRLWRRGAGLLEFRRQEPGQLLLQHLHGPSVRLP